MTRAAEFCYITSMSGGYIQAMRQGQFMLTPDPQMAMRCTESGAQALQRQGANRHFIYQTGARHAFQDLNALMKKAEAQ